MVIEFQPTMRARYIFFSLLTAFVFGCQDDSLDPQGGQTCFKVSYVTGICNQVVLKIETPAFLSLGESWNTHDNVFFTRLPCGVDEASLRQAPFYVSLLEKEELGTCSVCQAIFDYSGAKRYFIKIESSCSN